MSTFLQVLRLTFWTNPLQRVLTGICVILIAAENLDLLPYHQQLGGVFYSAALASIMYASMAGLLMGGVYWRIASAPRIVRLAPHGRARLLGGVVGVVLLVTLLWTAQNWVFFLRWVDPKFLPSITGQLVEMAGIALVLSVAVLAAFIASRSPLAALLVLIALVSPGLAIMVFEVELQRQVRPAQRVIALLAVIWIPFSIWYLNARRIGPPRWLASGGQDVLATATVSAAMPKSRGEAVERLLLGGTTVPRLGLLWFVVLGLLLALQWLIALVGEPRDPVLVARAMYVSLCICPVVTTVVSFAAIRRSRAPWLLATSTRVEYFARIDSILLRLNSVMALVHAIWLVAVWFAYSRQPGPLLEQLDAAQLNWMLLWVPGFFATNAQLALLPKWPVAILATCALGILWWLSAAGTRGYLLTVLVLITAVIATFALRVQARRRWRDGDFPRAATSSAS